MVLVTSTGLQPSMQHSHSQRAAPARPPFPSPLRGLSAAAAAAAACTRTPPQPRPPPGQQPPSPPGSCPAATHSLAAPQGRAPCVRAARAGLNVRTCSPAAAARAAWAARRRSLPCQRRLRQPAGARARAPRPPAALLARGSPAARPHPPAAVRRPKVVGPLHERAHNVLQHQRLQLRLVHEDLGPLLRRGQACACACMRARRVRACARQGALGRAGHGACLPQRA